MSDETKRFDPLGEDNEIDELIRSTREEIERMDRLYAGQPVTPEPEAPKQEQKTEMPKPEQPHPQEPVRYVHSELQPEEDEEEEDTRMSGGLKAFLYVIGVLVAAALIGLGAWLCADDVCAFTKPDQDITVTVSETDTVSDVATTLKAQGLIRYKWLFMVYANMANAEDKIKPGTYILNNTYDYHALVSGMSGSGRKETISVTIPEGYECKQIFELLEENRVCTATELYETAATYDFDYAFLDGLAMGEQNRLEGYLFPDTYEFFVNDTPENVLAKLLDNFEAKVDEELLAQIDTLNASLTEKMRAAGFSEEEIAANQMDLHRVITVASLIEKEAAAESERATVASVIYNRLCSNDYPYLQIDATIQYILEERKENLTLEDQQIDNPYNTYRYEGLPPGPIANLGLASIKAALSPENTNYYFYALESDGTHHHFSETYSEHQQFLESQKDGQA